jgi:hypothetical protein
MLCHISSKLKGKGKHKHGEGSSSSSQAQSDMSAFLFTVIVSFPSIFIYTCSFEFIVIFYLTYVMFLLAGHNGLLAATGVDSWGAARPRTTLNSGAAHGWRGGSSRGVAGSCATGGSHGGGGSRGAGGSREGGCTAGERPAAIDQLHVS